MQFNSFIFVFLFMPLITLLYFLFNKLSTKAGKIILALGSLCFYGYAGLNSLLLFSVSILMNYAFVLLIRQSRKFRKLFMLIPVIINICLLLVFKYTGFAISNINSFLGTNLAFKELLLPLGISFYTFQQIAYVVGVYNKEILEPNFLDYLVYILYFPKILMGPLTDPVDFISQLNNSSLKRFNYDNFACGLKIFCYGLFKKAILADTFFRAVDWGFQSATPDAWLLTASDCLLVMLFYTFEIYFDFSGYSDMAVGASLMLNITLPINFDSPYKALSIRDFWKRWHISLTKFFTKYVYIPLGGSRKGKFFTYLNTMIVFAISGLWHGANWTFILWGILHGILSVLERIFDKVLNKIWKPIRWVGTFLAISFLWLLFRCESVAQWRFMLYTILRSKDFSVSYGLLSTFFAQFVSIPNFPTLAKIRFDMPAVPSLYAVIFSVVSFVICLIPQNNYRNLNKLPKYSSVIASILFILSLFTMSSESLFVYNNF